MWNLFKNLFWEKDIYKRAEKFGIDPCSSYGIDFETFVKHVKNAENSFYSRQAVIISIVSLLVSIVAIAIPFLR